MWIVEARGEGIKSGAETYGLVSLVDGYVGTWVLIRYKREGGRGNIIEPWTALVLEESNEKDSVSSVEAGKTRLTKSRDGRSGTI